MSRTNDVKIAMQYAKSGVDGVHLMDSHKATIGWVVNTLAAEVERLEAECCTVELLKNLHKAAEARVAMADQSIDELQAALNTQQARVAELEAQNARLRAALERLDALYISEFDHEDRPPRPQWLQEALNGEEAK